MLSSITALLTAALVVAGPVDAVVTLPSEPGPLAGSLMTPEGPTRAAAVIIPGSGPTDRNGDSPLGVKGGVFRQLAEGLADRGVATVRIDKRGIGGSAFAAADESDLRFAHYAADAQRWAAFAAERTGQPCAWLIGHSEGALVALAAVAEGDDAICGLVLVSGLGRPAGVVLREQLASLPEPLKAQAFDTLRELEAGRTVADPPPALAALFRPSVQPYLISFLGLDPAALLAAYEGPALIVQGDNDLQVTLDDANALAAARADAPLVVLEGVNHVLRVAPTDRAANAATYADADLPLAPGVVAPIADFILAPR